MLWWSRKVPTLLQCLPWQWLCNECTAVGITLRYSHSVSHISKTNWTLRITYRHYGSWNTWFVSCLKIYNWCDSVCVPLYRVSQEECARLREGVPYVKVYQYNPNHLCPKLNGYRDNGQRKVWSSLGFHTLYLSADSLMHARLQCGVILQQFSSRYL
jgi:hypothetical protein